MLWLLSTVLDFVSLAGLVRCCLELLVGPGGGYLDSWSCWQEKLGLLAEQGKSDLWCLVRLGEHGGTGLLQDLASCHGCGLGSDIGIGDAAKG